MPKMGKVCICHGYAVDMDNQNQVDDATEALYEDLMNAYKNGELGRWIGIVEDDSLTIEDIPEFLTEDS